MLRIRAVSRNDRQQLLEILAEQFALKLFLTSVHPVLVATHGVDLTVVAHETERLSPRPAGEGVGAES